MTEAQRENPSRRLRVFTQSPAEFFDEGLRQIEKTRMAGLPILNPKLVVRSAGWRRWGNDWIGVVTTPWAVLGIYACGSREGWVDVPADRTRIIELPAGDFPFRAGASFCRSRARSLMWAIRKPLTSSAKSL